MNQQQMLKLKKMQKQMMDAQAKLEASVFTGTAGGGMVTVEIKGTHEVLSVKIDPEALESKEDIENLEPFSALLLGNSQNMTDTIMVFKYNP